MIMLTRREDEKIAICTPNKQRLEITIIRSRNGAVSVSVEMPEGYAVQKPAQRASFGLALAAENEQSRFA